MVDVTSDAAGKVMRTAPDASAADAPYESDFSLRKIRVATVVLLGQTFATSMLPMIALPLLFQPMTAEFGWTPTQFSLATSSLMFVGAFSVLAFGWLVDRIGARPIIVLGTVIVGLVTMAISQVNSLFTFCLAFAGLGLFGSTGMVYAKVAAGLFNQHRGKALAILGAESAIAFAIAPQIIRFLLEDFGWRQTSFIMGIVIISVVPLVYFFLDEVGHTSSSRDLFKFTKKKAALKSNEDEPAPADLQGMTIKEIVADRVFWLILLATLIAGAPRGGLFTFLNPMLTERGFDGQAATANFLSTLTLMAALGALVSGFILDKFHSTKVAVPFKLVAMLALVLLGVVTASFGGMILLMTAGILWGISDGATRPLATYFKTRLFGLKAFGTMTGLTFFVFALFLAVLPPLVGLSQEATGSYDSALWIMAGFLFIGALIYLVLGPYRYGVMVGATKVRPGAGEKRAAQRPAIPATSAPQAP